MFFNKEQALSSLEEDSNLIFHFIDEDNDELVEEALNKKYIDINLINNNKDSLMIYLLKKMKFNIILNNIKNKEWNINYQNIDGNTFLLILASINNINSLPIIKEVINNKNLDVNITNKKGETVLDICLNNDNNILANKIIENEEFININITTFAKYYNKLVDDESHGKYSKILALEKIIKLNSRKLDPIMMELTNHLKDNLRLIKKELEEGKEDTLNKIFEECVNQYQ